MYKSIHIKILQNAKCKKKKKNPSFYTFWQKKKKAHISRCKIVHKCTIATAIVYICTVIVTLVFNIIVIFSLSLALLLSLSTHSPALTEEPHSPFFSHSHLTLLLWLKNLTLPFSHLIKSSIHLISRWSNHLSSLLLIAIALISCLSKKQSEIRKHTSSIPWEWSLP